MEVRKKISQRRAPSAYAIEAPDANSPNQEHHWDDAAQYFDSDIDFIVETTVHDNEDDALERERENCTLWINQSVDWTSFLTDNSYNANNEDLNKYLQTIHRRYLHIDPLNWF